MAAGVLRGQYSLSICTAKKLKHFYHFGSQGHAVSLDESARPT